MSPTEDELRAALRFGEADGEPIDADTVILRARAHGSTLHERRVRVLSAAAVVAVVAGLGIGGGFVLGRHSNTHSAADNTQPSAATNAANAAGGKGENTTSNHYGTPGCPATLSVTAATSAPNPNATFFTEPVTTILVCAYATDSELVTNSAGDPIATTLSGAKAAEVARSIESARRAPLARPCPLYLTNQPTLLLRPSTGDGTTLPDVTTTALQNPCNATITNGTAVRYNWTPDLLAGYVAQLAKAPHTPAPSLPAHS